MEDRTSARQTVFRQGYSPAATLKHERTDQEKPEESLHEETANNDIVVGGLGSVVP